MSEDEKEIETTDEEVEELPETWEEYLRRLRFFIYNQPDILFALFLELLDVLVAREVIKKEDIEPLIRVGLERWQKGRI
jgi:hypothetical protein